MFSDLSRDESNNPKTGLGTLATVLWMKKLSSCFFFLNN